MLLGIEAFLQTKSLIYGYKIHRATLIGATGAYIICML
ncbi:hypothetical protein LPIBR_200016 [Lacticaseibacillus paracasei]|nr:hypothetical protein LPIBR_200016 [Lacticaseibacillus paracasei]